MILQPRMNYLMLLKLPSHVDWFEKVPRRPAALDDCEQRLPSSYRCTTYDLQVTQPELE